MARPKRARAKTKASAEPKFELNGVDRRHLAQMQTEKMRKQAMEEAANLAPSLVGVLRGLTEETHAQRILSERMLTDSGNRHQTDCQVLTALKELTLTVRDLTAVNRDMAGELSALRIQRAHGGNGHAKDDTLDKVAGQANDPHDVDE